MRRSPSALRASLSLLVTLVAGAGCQHFARGPGSAGQAPLERAAAVPGAAAAPNATALELPDPCRGTPLPLDQHFVAKGLCARVVASMQGELRQITFAPNGDLFGVTIPGAIRRYRDANHDGVFQPEEIVLCARWPPARAEPAFAGGPGARRPRERPSTPGRAAT